MHHYCGGHVAATAAAALLSPTLASPICTATAPRNLHAPRCPHPSRLDQHKDAKDTHRGEVEVLCEDPVCVGEARRTASGRHGSAGQELWERRLAAGGWRRTGRAFHARVLEDDFLAPLCSQITLLLRGVVRHAGSSAACGASEWCSRTDGPASWRSDCQHGWMGIPRKKYRWFCP